jgi:hypothetical protein
MRGARRTRWVSGPATPEWKAKTAVLAHQWNNRSPRQEIGPLFPGFAFTQQEISARETSPVWAPATESRREMRAKRPDHIEKRGDFRKNDSFHF